MILSVISIVDDLHLPSLQVKIDKIWKRNSRRNQDIAWVGLRAKMKNWHAMARKKVKSWHEIEI